MSTATMFAAPAIFAAMIAARPTAPERIKYLVHDRDNRYCAVFYGVFTCLKYRDHFAARPATELAILPFTNSVAGRGSLVSGRRSWQVVDADGVGPEHLLLHLIALGIEDLEGPLDRVGVQARRVWEVGLKEAVVLAQVLNGRDEQLVLEPKTGGTLAAEVLRGQQ